MGGRSWIVLLLFVLAVLALGSLFWAAKMALVDSADLERRAEEAALFYRRIDPYQDPDMTYPPSAPPVFLALIAPIQGRPLRAGWLLGNFVALAVFSGAILTKWGRAWPTWMKIALCLIFAASKPTRAGMALGQFHLMPMALIMLAIARQGREVTVIPGLLIGVALIKPTMIGPFLILLICWKQWGTSALSMIVQLGLTLGTSLWLGTSPMVLVREWLEKARGQLAMGTIDVPTLASRIDGFDGSKISLIMLSLSAVLLWVLRKKSELGLVSLSCFLAAIITYHRHYDMVLLLPTLAYFLDIAIRSRRIADIACAALATILLICPSPRHPGSLLEQSYNVAFLAGSYLGLIRLVFCLVREPGRGLVPKAADGS